MDDLEHRLQTCTSRLLEKNTSTLKSLEQMLEANSLSASLKRGFSLLSDEDGNLIRSTLDLPPGKRVTAHLEDGKRILEAQA